MRVIEKPAPPPPAARAAPRAAAPPPTTTRAMRGSACQDCFEFLWLVAPHLSF
jgi:hypothetical protein